MRLPTFAELRRFCKQDGWDEKKRTDHWRYTKQLPDGTTTRTKVSFGSGQIQDADVFAAILHEQLHTSREGFWRVVDRGGPAIRPSTEAAVPSAELPSWLWQQLLNEGAKRQEIAGLRLEEGRLLLDQLRSRPR